jgi:hypothetical protein
LIRYNCERFQYSKKYSDFDSSSSVACHDSDWSDSGACDSDKVLPKLLPSLIQILELMIATLIPKIQSRLQLPKTMRIPFDQAIMFLDLLHKQMLSGT